MLHVKALSSVRVLRAQLPRALQSKPSRSLLGAQTQLSHCRGKRFSSQNGSRWLTSSARMSALSDETGIRKQSNQTRNSLPDCSPILANLNPSQVEAVTQPLASITRVIAGPGSGKTRVLTSRIAYLLEQDKKARVLAVTFTRKAAGEMRVRLEKEMEQMHASKEKESHHVTDNAGPVVEEDLSPSPNLDKLRRVTLGTFHKVCVDILRYNGVYLSGLPSVQQIMLGSNNSTNLDGKFNILDQAEQLQYVKQCLLAKEIDLSLLDIKPMVLLNSLSKVKANAFGVTKMSEDDRKKLPAEMKIALEIYGLYRERMFSQNSLDFDDLIYLTRELLWEHQDVRSRLRKRWTHILVDEYQDTSRAQIDLIRLLTAHSLFVVGDGDQSIYSWRGADPNSLLSFDEEFQSFLGNVNTVHLMENYRSTSNIVSAAQKIISSENSEAKNIREMMKPKRGSGSKPRIVACADAKAEANFVVETIKDMIKEGKSTERGSMAVLYRTNAQSRELEEACVQNNLPYVILGKATSFYKRQEIKDSLCYLRWLVNGRDDAAMIRSMKTPSRGLGDKSIQQFTEYCTSVEEHIRQHFPEARVPTPLDTLLSLSANPPDSRFPEPSTSLANRPLKLFKEFSEQMRLFREKACDCTVEDLLKTIYQELEFDSYLDKISDSKTQFHERQSNVRELRRAAQKYSLDGASLPRDSEMSPQSTTEQPPLICFLDDVALVTELTDTDESVDRSEQRFVVNLMTIHAAKGLEFDSVFVVGNEDETFPTSRAIHAGKASTQLAEERRLCYVAITRAKSNLVLTWKKTAVVFSPKIDMGYKVVSRKRSRFLDALVAKKGSEGTKEGKPKTARSRPTARTCQRKYSTNAAAQQNQRRGVAQRDASPGSCSCCQDTGASSVNSTQRQYRRLAELGSSHKPIRRSNEAIPKTKVDSKGVGSKRKAMKPKTFGQAMDSSWFFPVGSSVVHSKLGRGLVLNPPTAESKEDLMVRVQFENGKRVDLPARGSDLKPDLKTW